MLILCGFTNNQVYRGSHEKLIYRRELPKEGGNWLGQFADLRGGWQKRGRSAFEGVWGVDNPIHTMNLAITSTDANILAVNLKIKKYFVAIDWLLKITVDVVRR